MPTYLYFIFFNTLRIMDLASSSSPIAHNYSLDVDGEAHDGYYISCSLGTPPQKVNLLIDTGSSNFAIAASNTESPETFFNSNESKTFQRTDKTLTVRYTEGSWSGFIGYDRITLCTEEEPWCSFESQFACITKSENIFGNSSWMGILGLAYPSIVYPPSPDNSVSPFFTGLVERHFLKSRIFALSLCGPFLESHDRWKTQRKLHLGYMDDDYYTGEVIYTPIIKEWYYEVTLTGLKVGDNDFDKKGSCMELNNDKTIIDTGTTYLAFPHEIHEWIVLQCKGALKSYFQLFPDIFWSGESAVCSDHKVISAFPVITLEFYHSENSTFSLQISPDSYLLKYEHMSSKEICYKFGLSSNKKKGTVIGASALKNFYVIFDQSGTRVGFANSTCNEASIVTRPIHRDGLDLDCKHVNTMSIELKIVSYAAVTIALAFALPLSYILIQSIYHSMLRQRSSSETSSLVSEVL